MAETKKPAASSAAVKKTATKAPAAKATAAKAPAKKPAAPKAEGVKVEAPKAEAVAGVCCPKEFLKVERIHLSDLDTAERHRWSLRQCHAQLRTTGDETILLKGRQRAL